LIQTITVPEEVFMPEVEISQCPRASTGSTKSAPSYIPELGCHATPLARVPFLPPPEESDAVVPADSSNFQCPMRPAWPYTPEGPTPSPRTKANKVKYNSFLHMLILLWKIAVDNEFQLQCVEYTLI
jgi:hypothetical protein